MGWAITDGFWRNPTAETSMLVSHICQPI
jgi:hypothetical protein